MAFDKGHALVIGVGSHQHHPGIDVPISVTDAEAVAAVLADANACGYPAGQVQLVHDAGATKAGILAALDDLAAAAKPDDTAFLFFCGHGALGTDGNYYLVGHDARVQNGRVVAGTGVSEAELLKKLRGIQAQRMLLLFNACHSGNLSPTLDIAPETLAASNPDADAAAALLGTGTGRIIMVACREQQLSYIGKGTLSIFTQALVDGLRGKGSVRNSHGFISAFSLYEHLYEAVGEVVKAQCKAVQEPELTVLRGVGPFAVALYKGASALGDFPADEPLPQGKAAREVSPEKSARSFRQHIDTGGGAYVGGSVHTGGGDFIGRDKIVHGDEVHGDKVMGDKVGRDKIAADGGSAVNTGSGVASVGDGNTVITGKVGRDYVVHRDEVQNDKVGADKINGVKYEIHLGSSPQDLRAVLSLAQPLEQSPKLKPERIRLDVAAPRRTRVGVLFLLAVAVKQPDSPPLRLADLPAVTAGEGEIYRYPDQPTVKYRVEIAAADFEIPTPSHVFHLEAGRDSPPRYFQLKPLRKGTLPLLVSAYQLMEDEELAAQTRLSIKARLKAVD